MLDCIENLSDNARSTAGAPEPATLDACVRLLRQHRVMPRLIRARSGYSAGGLALRVSIRGYLDSPDCAREFNDRMRYVLECNVPLTIALTDAGLDGAAADATAALEAFCNALREALLMVEEEGLAARQARHRRHHQALLAGVEAMGLCLVPPAGERLWTLNAVRAPQGVDEAAVRRTLLSTFNLEVGAGLGPLAGKIWRVGLMGASSTPQSLLQFLGCLVSHQIHSAFTEA